jgi:ParB family chromosome partitioning protein
MPSKQRPKGLGLGLEALLGPKVNEATGGTASGAPTELPLADLRAGRYQPRTRIDEGGLHELADSIRSQGVMQPVLVRRLDGDTGGTRNGGYEIIAGERRFRAAKLAGLDRVPVIVREVNDETAAVMALVENLQREDLNPLDEAEGLQHLIAEFRWTHEQAAQAVGKSRSAVSNALRLRALSAPVQQLLLAGDLEMGHARALLALSAGDQVAAANEVVARKLSVREAEKLVARRAGGGGRQAPLLRVPKAKPRDLARIEEQLADALGAPVDIRIKRRTKAGEAGEIVIGFGSLEELNGLLERLGLQDA